MHLDIRAVTHHGCRKPENSSTTNTTFLAFISSSSPCFIPLRIHSSRSIYDHIKIFPDLIGLHQHNSIVR